MTFQDLGLSAEVLKSLEEKGYTNPSPIQEQSIPLLLKGGDLLGCAQTGTGKTAAFAIPIIEQLMKSVDPNSKKKIKALVITPTRELALQIDENFKAYSKYTHIRNTVIFGGVKQSSQVRSLRQGVDILVATPGRLLDLIDQRIIGLRDIEHFVLDEADQMLDMGFIHDIKKILAKLPRERQSLFFSATMPKTISELSSKILTNHKTVTIKPEQATAEKVDQFVYHVIKSAKTKLLIFLLNESSAESVLVFTRTKHGADKVVKQLDKAGIVSQAIHGNKSQGARQRALSNFKDGSTRVLIATDIAARGIDVSGLELVIQFELPNVSETYVHRIGRTGRAKASGIALAFCDPEERKDLKGIERLIKMDIDVVKGHPFEDAIAEKNTNSNSNNNGNDRGGNGSSRSGRGGGKWSKKKSPNSGNSSRSGTSSNRRRS